MYYMAEKINETTNLEKLTQEIRRGVLSLATLSQLHEPRYGYDLIERMAQQGLEIDQGTLYPLLRRLEEQGLLQSEWKVEDARPRRYYVISPAGLELLEKMKGEWQQLTRVMEKLLQI